jgi:hypothetical protein
MQGSFAPIAFIRRARLSSIERQVMAIVDREFQTPRRLRFILSWESMRDEHLRAARQSRF